MTIERTDPPYDADEVGMLRGFLDHYRATIRLQAAGLGDAQLDQSLPPSDLTLGGQRYVQWGAAREQVPGSLAPLTENGGVTVYVNGKAMDPTAVLPAPAKKKADAPAVSRRAPFEVEMQLDLGEVPPAHSTLRPGPWLGTPR